MDSRARAGGYDHRALPSRLVATLAEALREMRSQSLPALVVVQIDVSSIERVRWDFGHEVRLEHKGQPAARQQEKQQEIRGRWGGLVRRWWQISKQARKEGDSTRQPRAVLTFPL